jgi:hypothetical protein
MGWVQEAQAHQLRHQNRRGVVGRGQRPGRQVAEQETIGLGVQLHRDAALALKRHPAERFGPQVHRPGQLPEIGQR